MGRGLHTLSACSCSVPTCLPFLKRSRSSKVSSIFASRNDTFLFLHVLFGSFPSWLCHFFLMISCPLQDLSILRFISVNEESFISFIIHRILSESQAEGVTSAGSPLAVFHPGGPGALPHRPPPFHNPWGSSQAEEGVALIQKDLALAFSTHLRALWIGPH